MFFSVPMLDVFFIDLETPTVQSKNKSAKILKAASWIVGGPVAYFATTAGLKSLGADGVSLKRLIDEKHFNIISSRAELAKYENANGSEWVVNSKSLKQRQYYIRHPKKQKGNILIEAQSFCEYIEDEQKAELVNYIMSHCPVKSIQISRTEITEAGGRANVVAEGAELSGGVNVSKAKENYCSLSWPNGAPPVEPREHYVWIKKSVMDCISALTEGSPYTDTYVHDFTFGLSAGEAKTIGLTLDKHKKYSYAVHIEC